MIAAVDLPEEITHDIESAKTATGVTKTYWYQNDPGNSIGVYLTDAGCPNPISTPADDPWGSTYYHRFSGSPEYHSSNTTGIIRSVSSHMFLYCRDSFYSLPTSDELLGRRVRIIPSPALGSPPMRIITPIGQPIYIMSQSGSDKSTNQYMILDRDYDDYVYNNGILHINSAGNNVSYVGSPGKALNVLTIGNYDHRTNTIASSSTYGNPATHNEKPEISAPGKDIAAGGFTLSGTSMSTPHAAGIAANFMSYPGFSFLKYRPALAKAQMIASAVTPVSGGVDKVGMGGIRYNSGMKNYQAYWFEGPNDYFDSIAVNGAITRTFEINAMPLNKIRVVVAWLNRGSFTYEHRNDAHPIGMDIDLTVYDPDGNIVGSSASWDNPFEVVEFTPPKEGTYTYKITRPYNRDTSSKIEMGVWIYKGAL